jgi:cyclic pyranopterin phosphate synthase
MSERYVPILPDTPAPLSLPESIATNHAGELQLIDTRMRPLTDLRISVTDRCNFRCRYCMPREVFDTHYRYLPHPELLRFEEITRLARLFVERGVTKIRLTGGEPLLRKDIEELVAQLAALRTPAGKPLDLTLTTNGVLLTRKAQALKDAGLRRITVSLDALDDALFRRINDADFSVAGVLDGIEAAQVAHLAPIKINMVVQRGVNDHQILPMARHFKGSGMTLRFIEYMDVGATNGWRLDQVLPSREVLALLQSEFDVAALEPAAPGETAERWGYLDSNGEFAPELGEVGFISSVTQAFCRSCSRARLSTNGRLYLCLFADAGYDLRAPLRSGVDDATLSGTIAAIWQQRSDRYSELRALASTPVNASSADQKDASLSTSRIEMSFIGG